MSALATACVAVLCLSGVALPVLAGGRASGSFAAVFPPGTDMADAVARVAAEPGSRVVALGASWPVPVVLVLTDGARPSIRGALVLPGAAFVPCAVRLHPSPRGAA